MIRNATKMPRDTQIARLLQYVQDHGMIRARDLSEIDVPRSVLKRLVDRGDLVRRSRGVYTLPDHELTRHTDLAEVCARAPKAIVCLISALEFHELTTQIPHSVWIMIDRAGRRPKIEYPPIRVVFASGDALTSNVEIHEIEGVEVSVTDPTKTVADCFKYRNHVGLDVAIEALRDCLHQRRATPSDIYEVAKIDRVAKTIRPYLEAMV